MQVILDTNIIIDVLQNREPWVADGAAIFRAIALKQITGCITAKQIADIHFFARKALKGEEHVDAKARDIVGKLMGLFEVTDTLGEDCRAAIGIENGDFEDAILIASATRDMADCIVTRNPVHFRQSLIPVYSPSEFAATLNKETDE